MLAELASFLDVLRNFAGELKGRKDKAEREKFVLTLLETYFYLRDAAEEGYQLFMDASPNPVEVIKSLSPSDAQLRLAYWDNALQRQSFRLFRVDEMIFGEAFMEVVSPGLEERLHQVIGSKFERANSLHAIGAAMTFRDFGRSTPEEQAGYVSVLAGEENDALDMERIGRELETLKQSLENFRAAVTAIVSKEEISALSKAARAETLLPTPPKF